MTGIWTHFSHYGMGTCPLFYNEVKILIKYNTIEAGKWELLKLKWKYFSLIHCQCEVLWISTYIGNIQISFIVKQSKYRNFKKRFQKCIIKKINKNNNNNKIFFVKIGNLKKNKFNNTHKFLKNS